MTLEELFNEIRDLLKKHPSDGNRIVCIPNNKIGLGGTKVTEVKSIGGGIDWDAKKLFIFPEKAMQDIEDEPLRFDPIMNRAEAFALKEMKGKFGEDWEYPKSKQELSDYIGWCKMFIRDQFKLFSKY